MDLIFPRYKFKKLLHIHTHLESRDDLVAEFCFKNGLSGVCAGITPQGGAPGGGHLSYTMLLARVVSKLYWMLDEGVRDNATKLLVRSLAAKDLVGYDLSKAYH